MIATMQMTDANTFTQKDLMHHLLQAAQHAVTREELQTAKAEIIADMDRRFEQVGIRFEQVEKRFEQIDKRFEQVDKRFEQMDKRFEQVDKRFEQVDKRFDELKADIKIQGSELRADIKEQGRRHDRLSWAIFAGMLALFFKDYLTKVLLTQ